MKNAYQMGWRDAYHTGKYCNPFNPRDEKDLFDSYRKGHSAGCDAFERW